ncbi:hypothetical protein HYS95_03210 [Candidatus Daviesbacteria bacterium]|nr:hypothetical protein [Candidatus Daviesbacteria bacterium]
MFARIFAPLLITFLFILPVNAFAKSDTPTASQSAIPITTYTQLPPTVSPTSPIYTDLLVHNLFHSFSCLAIGQSIIGQPCLTYQFTQNAQGAIQGVPILSQANLQGGALGTVTGIIGGLYQNPPVRTADYLATVGQGLGIVKPANAQVVGSGQAVLNPILSLWQVSRNVSYVLLIIIFLIIGVMVMFRNKLNPQTVITIQTALPGLIIGLILITFSYFLAGLLTDFAFIGTNIVGYYFQAAQQINPPPPSLTEQIQQQSVLSIFSRFVGIVTQADAANAIDSIFNGFTPEVQNYLRIFAGIIAFQFTGQIGGAIPVYGVIIGPILGLISAISIQAGISPILGFFVSLVSVAILIYAMLKLLLKLINNYLNIIFLTITAPFQFLAASLPGRQGIVTGWIMSMLCNILAFPAVIAVFYFVNYLVGSAAVPNSPFAVGPDSALTGQQSLPLFGGINLSFIQILVAFGALIATPTIPDIICRALGRASQAGQMIGQEIGGSVRSGQGYATQTGQRGFAGAQGLSTAIGGQTEPVYVPGVGVRIQRTRAGLRDINRNGSWNPLRWRMGS